MMNEWDKRMSRAAGLPGAFQGYCGIILILSGMNEPRGHPGADRARAGRFADCQTYHSLVRKCVLEGFTEQGDAVKLVTMCTTGKNDDQSSSTQFNKQFWTEYREALVAEVRARQRLIKLIERNMRDIPRVDTKPEKQ